MTGEKGSDVRFEFLQVLNEAIPQVCDGFESRYGDAFIYRGQNLRFAIERALYFWAVNEESLYCAFAERASGPRPETIRAMVDSALESRMAPNRRGPFEFARRIRARVRHVLHSRGVAKSAGRSPSIETIFVLHHPKFVRYLAPVLSELGESAAICSVDSRDLAAGQFRQVSAHPPRLVWGPAGIGLRGFPHFLQVFDMLCDTFRRERPTRAVVAEGNSPFDEIVNQAAASLGIPTVCVQQGWSPVAHAGFRNMTYNPMLVWGEGFADLLQPFNKGQRFLAVGNPAISSETKAQSKSDHHTIAFFLQAPSPLIGGEVWALFLELAKWTARNFPGARILVREHPNHRLSAGERELLADLPNVRFPDPGTTTLADVLSSSTLMVTMYSSTIMESIAVGVLPVIANFTSMPAYWPDVDALHAAIEVKTESDAQAAIKRCLTDPDYYASFEKPMQECAQHYFAARDGQAVSNIVDAIRSAGHTAL